MRTTSKRWFYMYLYGGDPRLLEEHALIHAGWWLWSAEDAVRDELRGAE
jgi:hypothetical protein